MSLFSFGDYSADIDFTDADVQDRFGEAYERMKEDLKNFWKIKMRLLLMEIVIL